LRRAVSAAYYALFHLLIDAATKQFAGAGPSLSGIRHVLARGYNHAEMAAASKSFAGGALPASVQSATGHAPVPVDLQTVADVFRRLQEARHEADYNLAKPWTRSEVLIIVDDAAAAFAAWRRVRHDPMAILYLGLLGSHDSVRRR